MTDERLTAFYRGQNTLLSTAMASGPQSAINSTASACLSVATYHAIRRATTTQQLPGFLAAYKPRIAEVLLQKELLRTLNIEEAPLHEYEYQNLETLLRCGDMLVYDNPPLVARIQPVQDSLLETLRANKEVLRTQEQQVFAALPNEPVSSATIVKAYRAVFSSPDTFSAYVLTPALQLYATAKKPAEEFLHSLVSVDSRNRNIPWQHAGSVLVGLAGYYLRQAHVQVYTSRHLPIEQPPEQPLMAQLTPKVVAHAVHKSVL